MTEWRVLPCSTPGMIWTMYAEAIGGVEKMREIYGDHWPPWTTRPGESVFVVRDPAQPTPIFHAQKGLAAWMSLTIDQLDGRDCHLSRGIWPEYMGKGLGRWTLDWADKWALEAGCTAIYIHILQANERHFRNVFNNPYWKMCGIGWDPDGVGGNVYTFQHKLWPREA